MESNFVVSSVHVGIMYTDVMKLPTSPAVLISVSGRLASLDITGRANGSSITSFYRKATSTQRLMLPEMAW